MDLHKAFDSLDWNFMLNGLTISGFTLVFIRWVEARITNPWYSVMFNGSLIGYFRREEELRQGNLLSPYLFVLTIEVLSQLLNATAKDKRIGFHCQCRKLNMTHLGFTDDILIFIDGACTFCCYCRRSSKPVLKLNEEKNIIL